MVADQLTGFSLAERDRIGTKKEYDGPSWCRSKCPSLALGYPRPLGNKLNKGSKGVCLRSSLAEGGTYRKRDCTPTWKDGQCTYLVSDL